jgi:ORF6N domain
VISLPSFDSLMSEVATTAPVVEDAIRVIRGQRVMLDSDLARFFGVTTKALNQTLQRNLERFPSDFAFVLTRVEFASLRSQIVTSNIGRGGRRSMPWAFTEHGVIMVASLLNSPIAVAASVRIVRTFVRMRELIVASLELSRRLEQVEQRMDKTDENLSALFAAIRQLLDAPTAPAEREMGFHVREDEPAYGKKRKSR